MPEFRNVPEQLTALADLHSLLGNHDVAYWLFGGWAVDFHAGRVTREHADIDIAIWQVDSARVANLLEDAEWMHRPQPGEDGYTCYERRGIRLEVAFLARDELGNVYTPVQNGRGEWPSNSFGDDVAELRGVRVRVMSREALIADKSTLQTDADVAAKDRADIASLVHPHPRALPPDDR